MYIEKMTLFGWTIQWCCCCCCSFTRLSPLALKNVMHRCVYGRLDILVYVWQWGEKDIYIYIYTKGATVKNALFRRVITQPKWQAIKINVTLATWAQRPTFCPPPPKPYSRGRHKEWRMRSERARSLKSSSDGLSLRSLCIYLYKGYIMGYIVVIVPSV